MWCQLLLSPTSAAVTLAILTMMAIPRHLLILVVTTVAIAAAPLRSLPPAELNHQTTNLMPPAAPLLTHTTTPLPPGAATLTVMAARQTMMTAVLIVTPIPMMRPAFLV
jgi:hypothetical protein